MVLSIAFILAFVISAIVLLIGILIFSDVSEAMSLTLPVDNFVQGSPEDLVGCTSSSLSKKSFNLVNKTDGTMTIINQPVTVSGFTWLGCTGMATDPTTGIMYAIMKHSANQTDRRLITIDPTTGIGTDVGAMGNKFASLAFKSDGTLRTITGFGLNDYHSVNKATGQTALLCKITPPLPEFGGVSLAFNSDDGKMYHATGNLGFGTNGRFSTIDSETPSPTECPRSDVTTGGTLASGTMNGNPMGEPLDFVYNSGDGLFYYTSFDGISFGTVSTLGFITEINTNALGSVPVVSGHELKGLAFTLGGAGSGTPLTPTEQNQIETFNQALNVAFTVIGILPVALFFALFAIFSGRTGTE